MLATKDTKIRKNLKEVLEYYGVRKKELEQACDAAMFAIIRGIDEDKELVN